MKASFLTLALATLATTGCATGTDHYKLLSTQAESGTVPATGQPVKGESCRRSILWVIPLAKDGTLEDAIANALEKVPGANALADLKVTGHNLMTVLYNYRCVEVEGRAVAVK